MRAVIVIAGPTGSGKTAVAAALARRLNGEIISADSRQVYTYLDVGTNKAGEWDPAAKLRYAGGIPQHLTDIIEPSGTFNAGEFARRAHGIIAGLQKEGKTPIVAGGTGLYVKALIDGLAPLPERDEKVRAALNKELERSGKEHLYERLKAVDPVSAEKNRGNPQRIVRALEVFELTGKPLSAWHGETKAPEGAFLQFGLAWERAELNAAIDRRSEDMLSSGMIDETKKVLSLGFPPDCPGLQSLGYRKMIEYLEGRVTREELALSLKTDTRQYAKRQMTWFKRDGRIDWIPVRAATFDPERAADIIFAKIPEV